MKYRDRQCKPCLVGPGRLSLYPPPPKSFFASKSKMALMGAISGALAYAMASIATTEKNAVLNKTALCLKVEENGKKGKEIILDTPILDDPVLYDIFRSGNSQHLVHSAALMAVPYAASKPILTTGLLAAGMVLFCGSQYQRAFNRKPDCCEAPLLLGTVCLLGSWLSFLL